MRRAIKKIIQILDGTPAVYGPVAHSRGQSVVELSLFSPILIVLIMGLVEIGWFANNYLILLETSRVGARFGTVQTGDTSPLQWDNLASLSPNRFPAVNIPSLQGFRNCSTVSQDQQYQGFYNLLSCIMLQSIAPLEFRSEAYPGDPNYDPPTDGLPEMDDIVISAFALQLVNPSDVPASLQGALSLESTVPSTVPQILVIGRYPTNANECTPTDAPRDPFDYIRNNVQDYVWSPSNLSNADIEINRTYLELTGRDSGNEFQRGFTWTGRHVISDSSNQCYGSEWTTAEVQQLVNLPGFSLLSTQRDRLASQGMVLVEMYWRHYLLLKNPVFNPVFTILGDQTVVSVWSAFPLPSVEPRIKYKTGTVGGVP